MSNQNPKIISGFAKEQMEDAAQHAKRTNFLLVIGIDEYEHCPRLYNCEKDAKELIEVLIDKYEFESKNILTLFNKQATKRNIYKAFRRLAEQITSKDNLIIYFSGHGEYDKVFNQGYWIPVKAKQGEIDQYIPNSEIKTILSAVKSHHTFLMSDSCFSGALFSKGLSKNITPRFEKDPSRWGLTAGRNEIVSDGKPGDNSPFAESLLYQLHSAEQDLGVQRLCTAVTEFVQANSDQTPIGEPLKIEGHKNGQFVFYLKKNVLSDWEKAVSIGTVVAYQTFIRKHPEDYKVREAKVQIEKIEARFLWAKNKNVSEEIRRQYARVLHDRVGSNLAATRWLFDEIKESQKNNSLTAKDIERVEKILNETYYSLRKIIKDLRWESNDWFKEIKEFCDVVSSGRGIELNLTTHGLDGELPIKTGTKISNMIFNMIANVLLHANATIIDLSIIQRGKALEISVKDNGDGFDISQKTSGKGLKNIKEDVLILGGHMKIESTKGQGTYIKINIPNMYV